MKINRHKKFDGIHPYTYYIRRKSDGLQYHGVRYANVRKNKTPNEDFLKNYFTSGILKEELKNNLNNFEYKVKWTFNTKEDALLYEQMVNKKLYKKDKWANMTFRKAVNGDEIKNIINKKYGVKNVSQLEFVKEKRKKTFIKNYGVDNPSKSKGIIDKIKQINLQKYGVEWSWQSEKVKNKIKQTNLQKYGVEWNSQSDIIKNKKLQHSLQKYGVTCSANSKIAKEKSKQTCLKKYGSENYANSELRKNRTKQKQAEKYGLLAKLTNDEFDSLIKTFPNWKKCRYKTYRLLMLNSNLEMINAPLKKQIR